jgi:hypothetical protein
MGRLARINMSDDDATAGTEPPTLNVPHDGGLFAVPVVQLAGAFEVAAGRSQYN